MPGMGKALTTNNQAIVSAFQGGLLHQGLLVLLIVALVAVAWNVLRAAQYRRALQPGAGSVSFPHHFSAVEPAARRLLRISFGLIWAFDGILQGQASMPLGLVANVVQPAASSSPTWVTHLVNAGTTVWSYHPVVAAAGAVWAQIGLGVWLLAAPRGDWSRLAGLVSCGWGLVVWVFGEAFGGVFAPGLSWMFGAPGAVLFYCLAGGLVALPETAWSGPRLGRALLRAIGLFFVGMALLQAWPGRGFWQGQSRPSASAGSLTSMLQQMTQTPQPHFLSSWIAAFGRFDAAHGWSVNFFVVVALAAIGTAFLSGRPTLARYAVVGGTLVCLADWVLVEDLGFLGGVGTDPNSMVPMALVFGAAYLAVARAPAPLGRAVVPISAAAPSLPYWERLVANPTYTFPRRRRPGGGRDHARRCRPDGGGGRQPARRPRPGPGDRWCPSGRRRPRPPVPAG